MKTLSSLSSANLFLLNMAESSDTADWRSKFSNVVELWSEARKRNVLTDVDFLIGEGDSAETFSAHRNILAFSSIVFEAMFYGGLAEKKSPIAIVDIEPEAFEILLRYSYAEKITFTSVACAAKTFIAADKYLITGLKATAEDYVSKATMNDFQFWEVIHQDRLFSIPVIKKKCLNHLSIYAATLLKSDLLLNISSDAVEAILQMDKIGASEYELLIAISRWGRGASLSETKMKRKLESLIRYIRFSKLSVDEFCNFSDSHGGLISHEDSLAILKHLYKPSNYKLPPWCSTSTKQRNG